MVKIKVKKNKLSNSEKKLVIKYIKELIDLDKSVRKIYEKLNNNEETGVFDKIIIELAFDHNLAAIFYNINTRKERQILNKLLNICNISIDYHYMVSPKEYTTIIPDNIYEIYISVKKYTEYSYKIPKYEAIIFNHSKNSNSTIRKLYELYCDDIVEHQIEVIYEESL